MIDRDVLIKAIKCRQERNKRCIDPCENTGFCQYSTCVYGVDHEPYFPYFCDTEKLCGDILELIDQQDRKIAVKDTIIDVMSKEISFLRETIQKMPAYKAERNVADDRQGEGY